jgi:hypothetical protein
VGVRSHSEILSGVKNLGLKVVGSRTYKPNFVCREAPLAGTTYRRTAIPLGRTLLCGSSDLPEGADAPSRHASAAAAGRATSCERRCTSDPHSMDSSKLVTQCSPLNPQRRRNSLPIWSCSVWGLPCPSDYSDGGALLPHLFTLTPAPRNRASKGGIFSVALSVNQP